MCKPIVLWRDKKVQQSYPLNKSGRTNSSGTILQKSGLICYDMRGKESVELGYKGRVGLHSLPESERFYDNQQMTNYGKEEGEKEEDNLVYFEYGPLRQLQKLERGEDGI